MKSGLVALIAGLSISALAQEPAKEAPKPKLIPLKVCPIAGNEIKGPGGGSVQVGRYNVTLCCANCKMTYDKLEKKDRIAKVAAAAVATHKMVRKAERTQQAAETELIETKLCAIALKPVAANGPSSFVDTYVAHFCCDDCKGAFDKSKLDEKLTKIATALASEEPAKKPSP